MSPGLSGQTSEGSLVAVFADRALGSKKGGQLLLTSGNSVHGTSGTFEASTPSSSIRSGSVIIPTGHEGSAGNMILSIG